MERNSRSCVCLSDFIAISRDNLRNRIIFALLSDSAKPIFGDVGPEPSCETPAGSRTAQHAALQLHGLQSQRELFEILFEYKIFSTSSAIIILSDIIVTLRSFILDVISSAHGSWSASGRVTSLLLWALLLLFLVLPSLLLFLLRFFTAFFSFLIIFGIFFCLISRRKIWHLPRQCN